MHQELKLFSSELLKGADEKTPRNETVPFFRENYAGLTPDPLSYR